MHPDKNKTAGAEESFRILVAMYEVGQARPMYIFFVAYRLLTVIFKVKYKNLLKFISS